MKLVHRLQYPLLLAFAITIMNGCQKEHIEDATAAQDLTTAGLKIVVPSSATSFAAEQSNAASDYNTFYGPAVQMGKGHVRSWINITRADNKPLAIGIEITDAALQNLPEDAHNFAANTFMLALHQKAMGVTPFDHMMVNWEPEGHEPTGIYNVPHFDFHFYKISTAAQLMITPMPTAAPPAGYLPASYVIQGATVPQMGTHWLDPASPELPPRFVPFTHTFIYGSNTGKVIFLEPMITLAYLNSGSSVTKAIPQPMHFAPANTYYPGTYSIWEDAANGRHYVAMGNFVWR